MQLHSYYSLIVVLSYLVSVSCSNSPTLKSVVVIFRHGDRTIYESYPTDPYRDISYWPGGYAQLTNKGKLRLYNLGKWFREQYDGFIPQNYSLYDTYIRSTDTDRTLMSALAFLAGLYPPTEDQTWYSLLPWQPIPVHTESPAQDAVLAQSKPCQKYQKLYDELYKTTPFKTIQGQLEDLYAYISHHSGKDINVLWQLQDFYDLLRIEESFGYELPKWTKDIYPDKLKPWAIFAGRIPCFTPEMARLRNGLLINEITNHFLNASKYTDATYQRFKIYSAHETTIYNILTSMRAYNDLLSPYGAALIFELIEDNNNHFVNMLYKNSTSEVFEMTLDGCEFNCSLDKFVKILKPITIDLKSWENECTPYNLSANNFAVVLSFNYFVFSLTCIICVVRTFYSCNIE